MTRTVCQQRVGSGSITYACSLESGHEGPHYASEVPRSVAERERWESGAEARSALAEFQGVAAPFATPTPVPGTDQLPADYRSQNPPPPPGQIERPVEAPCSHPFSQVSPVDGGMYCAACGNVLEAPRTGDSLRGFMESAQTAQPPLGAVPQPIEDEGEVRDRLHDILVASAAVDAQVRSLLEDREAAREAVTTLYQVLLMLATKHPSLISFDQVDRLVTPVAKWVNGE